MKSQSARVLFFLLLGVLSVAAHSSAELREFPVAGSDQDVQLIPVRRRNAAVTIDAKNRAVVRWNARKESSTFVLRNDLYGPGDVSFELVSDGERRYLTVQQDGSVIAAPFQDTAAYKRAASFRVLQGLSTYTGVSFRSELFLNRWLRRAGHSLRVDAFQALPFARDATFVVSSVVGRPRGDSLFGEQFYVNSPSFPRRFFTFEDNFEMSFRDDRSPPDFFVERGLAGKGVSLYYSNTADGSRRYLRRRGTRVFADFTDGSTKFARDATWIALPGLSAPGAWSFLAFGSNGLYLRQKNFLLGVGKIDNPVLAAGATFTTKLI